MVRIPLSQGCRIYVTSRDGIMVSLYESLPPEETFVIDSKTHASRQLDQSPILEYCMLDHQPKWTIRHFPL